MFIRKVVIKTEGVAFSPDRVKRATRCRSHKSESSDGYLFGLNDRMIGRGIPVRVTRAWRFDPEPHAAITSPHHKKAKNHHN
jgi:hypothetical protein